ncbi:MAG: Zn-dependent alcohol dehydrogenase [Chloroflexi bacterium]|nr:Zn-dependent alcohol dehydrogenase [Chloroflexota bacterium]
MKARAAILREYQQPMSIEEVEIDPPKADEVLVKIAAAGVCHSDYHVMKGEWRNGLPMILGHEASGFVAEVGPGVKDLKPGDRCALSFRSWCGRCRYCIAGRPILCNGYDNVGPRGSMLDGTYRVHKDGEDIPVMGRMGGFAEYAVMPAQQLVPITADIGMDVLCLIGCAVTTGVGAVLNTAKVESGSTVAVIGTGGVGLNVVQGAVVAGASRIFAIDLLDNKLDYAGSFGATDLVNGSKADPVQQVLDLTDGQGVDYVFEAIGNVRATEQAIKMTARGGTTTLVGMAPQAQAATFDPLLFVQRETRMLGCFYGSFRPKLDFLRYVDMAMKGQLRVGEMISRRYSLDEINEAYDRLGRGEVARSVISFEA